MQALLLTGPSTTSDRTEIAEVPDPSPGPGEVTIDVTHAGVNFKDIMQRRGDPEWVTTWPVIPGMEVAGTIRDLGEGVDGLDRGQRVCAFAGVAGLAEVAKVRADLTVPVPDGVSMGLAAATPVVLTTAWLLLSQAGRLAPGETLLVHSAGGGVGTALARLAPSLGVGRLIGTVSNPDRVDGVLSAGYDACVVRDDTMVTTVRDIVREGVDVILDPLGASGVQRDIDMAALGGRIILFGNASGGSHDLPPLYALMGANVSIGGMSISALVARAPRRVADSMAEVLSMLEKESFSYPVSEIPLKDVPRVHEAIAHGRGAGKYVASVRRRSGDAG